MNTEDFLDILDERQLVADAILQQLRDKAAQGDRRITPKSMLKYLVKKELVTRSEAKQLLETTISVTSHAESSILGLVPMPKIPLDTPKPKGLADDEEIPTLAPIERAADESKPEVPPQATREEQGEYLSDSFIGKAIDDPFDEELPNKHEPAKPPRSRKRGKKNEWDSSLLLLGGGGLALLLIIGVVVGILIYREDADAVLAEAGEFFDGGSYTQAIKQYEHFVETFPRHSESSAAKVRLGMARLWKATRGTSDISGALQVAQKVLDDIKDEPEFHLAQRDLASRLPVIAQGLANQAEQATDGAVIEQLIDKTNAALALCGNTKYIPKTFRDPVLDEVGETLGRVKRGRQQSDRLTTALAEIAAAIEQSDIASAYDIHRQVIKQYPGLINDPTLSETVLKISAAEKSVVRYVAEPLAAATSPRPSNVVAALALADRSGDAAPDVDGAVAVRVGGAVFGLSRSEGSVLWRRFVGIDPRSTPLALPDGDVAVVDSTHHDLLKLTGETGKLVWRLELGAPLVQPVIHDGQLLVADASGRLHFVRLADGERSGYVQFGQPLRVSPVVGARGKRIYVVGEHSSLYTISTDDFSCQGVHYLGHPRGSVSTAPVTVLGKIVAAVNVGLETSQLNVLSTAKDGLITKRSTSRRLVGLVSTPLLVNGRRITVLTTRGQVKVYEASAGEGDDAMTEIASRDPVKGPPVARFGLVHQGHVWAAGEKLNKLAVMPTGNRLQLRTVENDYAGDTFDHPLQGAGDVLFHVRRRRDQGGAVVAAMEMTSGKALWQTELAVPLAGPPAVDAVGSRITAVTATGSGFVLDREALGRRVQDQAERLGPSRRNWSAMTEGVDLGQGRLAVASIGAPSLLHFRPAAPRSPLQRIKLAAPITCGPVVWGDAIVAPTEVGQVFLFAVDDGRPLGSPFQPALAPGAKYNWLSPAVFGAEGDASRLVISDGTKMIFAIAQVAEPQPHLEATAEADVGASPLNTRLAVLGQFVCAGTQDGQLARFTLPSLEQRTPVDLGAEVTWGPFTVGERIVLAVATDELVALDQQLLVVWRQPLSHGPPAGTPLADDEHLLLAWQSGGLSRTAMQDGAEAGYTELEQPVVAGPVPFGRRLVVATVDGTLLVVDRP